MSITLIASTAFISGQTGASLR